MCILFVKIFTVAGLAMNIVGLYLMVQSATMKQVDPNDGKLKTWFNLHIVSKKFYVGFYLVVGGLFFQIIGAALV
jgi:hypothetical protein